jgi:GAF domain
MAAAQQLTVAEKGATGPRGLSSDFDSTRTFEEITRSALHATGASGAALVLSDGKVMSCRACCGSLVPPVGTLLNSDKGFTATCVQTAQVVRCDDTETDTRVDGSICVELGIRSILAVPVFDSQNVAGVLEVLSSEPKRFTDRHATALTLLARLVETLVDYASHGDDPLAAYPGAKPQSNGPDQPLADKAKKTCLSCGHPNPQDSQFCNRCGVILLVPPAPPDATEDLSLAESTEASADEGFKEIYKLISGNPGRATWNEIYAKLRANMQNTSPQDKSSGTTTEATAKKDNGVVRFAKVQEDNELKSRPGGVIRRSLWL